MRVVAFGTDKARKWTAIIVSIFDFGQHAFKVILWPPTKLAPGELIHVHPLDGRKHQPAKFLVFRFIVRVIAPYNLGGVGTQLNQVSGYERRGGGNDVTTEADLWHALHCPQMGAHRILNIHAAVEILVYFHIVAIERVAFDGLVVISRKKRDVRNTIVASPCSR